MKQLHGILTAIVTPFDRDGRLNLDRVPAILDFQRSAGVDGVVVCGTNGEGTSMSVAERKALLEAVIAGADGLAVVAATGTANQPETVELTLHAQHSGADAALVLPPFYLKAPPDAGIAAYYRAILDAVTIPILLYSIPQMTGIAISDEVLDLLAGHPRLLGVKDSAGDWARTLQLLRERKDLRVFPGSDALLSQGQLAGAPGAISGTANAVPELVVGVRRACRSGGNAVESQERLDAARTLLLSVAPFAANKSVLAHRGVGRMWVRPPLIDLTDDEEARLISELRAVGVPVSERS